MYIFSIATYGSQYYGMKYRKVRYYDLSDFQLPKMLSQHCHNVMRYMKIFIWNTYEIFTSETLNDGNPEAKIQNSTVCERHINQVFNQKAIPEVKSFLKNHFTQSFETKILNKLLKVQKVHVNKKGTTWCVFAGN